MNYPKITVVVCTLNEENHIAQCLNSVLGQDYPGNIDIIVADGGSQDATISILGNFALKYSNIKLIDNPNKIQSSGRNLAVSKCETEFIAYLDAHYIARKDWISKMFDILIQQKNNNINIAGVGTAYYNLSDNEISLGYTAAVSSIICGAPKEHLLNNNKITQTDHALMCIYYRNIFKLNGGYDEKLPVGEDYEFNVRLIQKGYKIFQTDEKLVGYYPRTTFESIAKQQFNYGYWRQIVSKKLNKFSLISLIPAIFVLIMIILFLISFLNPTVFVGYFVILILYMFTLLTAGALIGLRRQGNPIMIAVSALVIHFSYGAGSLSALYKLLTRTNA